MNRMVSRIVSNGLLVGSFFCVLTFSGCDDECDGKKAPTSEFKIYQELRSSEVLIGKRVEHIKEVEEDTFLLHGHVTFEALEENAESYEWTIGTDTRKFTEKSFELVCDDIAILDENPLQIKLKIKKRSSKCFPNDNGYDSLTKLIYFINYFPIVGKYEGSDDSDASKKLIVEISYGSRPQRVESFWLRSLPNECNIQEAQLTQVTAFEFAIGNYNIFLGEEYSSVFRERDKHIGHLENDRRTLVIEYEFTGKDETDATKRKRTFRGVKI
jgi:hypothetical protein